MKTYIKDKMNHFQFLTSFKNNICPKTSGFGASHSMTMQIAEMKTLFVIFTTE